jgi:L-ascorbate metabolism protein UlaG (beta-lactamase superfamily)
MLLENLGRGCFRVRGSGCTIVADPYDHDDVPGVVAGADLVTSSRSRKDPRLRNESGGVIVDGPGEYEVRGVFVTGVRMGTVADGPGADRANTAYTIVVDDIAVCHLGHLSRVPTQEESDDLGSVDVLLLPVGGGAVLGPGQAIEVLGMLDPAIIVPMHYRSPETPTVEPVERFFKEMGIDVVEPVSRLVVTRGSLPEEPQVVVVGRSR